MADEPRTPAEMALAVAARWQAAANAAQAQNADTSAATGARTSPHTRLGVARQTPSVAVIKALLGDELAKFHRGEDNLLSQANLALRPWTAGAGVSESLKTTLALFLDAVARYAADSPTALFKAYAGTPPTDLEYLRNETQLYSDGLRIRNFVYDESHRGRPANLTESLAGEMLVARNLIDKLKMASLPAAVGRLLEPILKDGQLTVENVDRDVGAVLLCADLINKQWKEDLAKLPAVFSTYKNHVLSEYKKHQDYCWNGIAAFAKKIEIYADEIEDSIASEEVTTEIFKRFDAMLKSAPGESELLKALDGVELNGAYAHVHAMQYHHQALAFTHDKLTQYCLENPSAVGTLGEKNYTRLAERMKELVSPAPPSGAAQAMINQLDAAATRGTPLQANTPVTAAANDANDPESPPDPDGDGPTP